jgi:hypothetical protein
VGRAHQADVVGIVASPEPEGVPVVVLESVTLGAGSAFSVDEAAPALVAPIHGTPDRGRDVP